MSPVGRLEKPTPGWTFVHIGFDGEPFPGLGELVWRHAWEATLRTVVVWHPTYPTQRHTFPVYVLHDGDRAIEFAAGEYSNQVWGFWVPERQSRHDIGSLSSRPRGA